MYIFLILTALVAVNFSIVKGVHESSAAPETGNVEIETVEYDSESSHNEV